MELKASVFFLVGNIPPPFRSANLRTYFSQYAEKAAFACFHYKHRPEYLRQSESAEEEPAKQSDNPPYGTTTSASQAAGSKDISVSSRCCIVAVKPPFGNGFVKRYQDKNWSGHDGGLLASKVRLRRLNVADQLAGKKPATADDTSIPWEDLASLPELNPPNVMPQGNVGTPLSTFMTLIRTCKLPGHVIKKLQLEFPKSRSSKRYGAVKFDYGEARGKGNMEGGDGEEEEEEDSDLIDKGVASEDNRRDGDDYVEDERIPSDDDHDAEEWERYEAFHEDVNKQERTKERLFEEDLEVVWEKGGSGLVFYTDASHWDQQDGDFDEKCSQEDDWDVDMSVYYEQGGGSKDARDMRDMEMERRLRAGEQISEPWTQLGGFEKYTKGIGSKVLKRSGWVAGRGVGAASQGITEPLESEGQHPANKRGLGYRGEKLDRTAVSASKRRRRATKDVIISTVYDRVEEEEDTILRSGPPTLLKHRQQIQRHTEKVEFKGAGTYKAGRGGASGSQ